MSPRMPNADEAILDIDKLRRYCLNSSHPEGRHKARVFSASLGIGQQDAEWLRNAILSGLREAPVSRQETTGFGERYVVDMKLTRDQRCAMVRTCWIIRGGESAPRLVTCFVL